MFNTDQFFLFGISGHLPNTFIGGIGAVTNTASLLAIKLGLSVANIKSFKVEAVTNNVSCYISTTYILGNNAFYNNSDITYFRDEAGLVLQTNYRCFGSAVNLIEVNLPNTINLGSSSFYSCTGLVTVSAPSAEAIGPYAFYNADSMVTINLPSATTVDLWSFKGCALLQTILLPECITANGTEVFSTNPNLTTLDLSKLQTIASWGAFLNCTALVTVNLPELLSMNNTTFQNCSSLEVLSMPKLTTFGTSVGANAMWYLTKSGFTLTVPSALATVNAGAPDGDITAAINDKAATIIYV